MTLGKKEHEENEELLVFKSRMNSDINLLTETDTLPFKVWGLYFILFFERN